MTRFLILSLLIFPLSLPAAVLFGQEGNGGNVCSRGVDGWVALEEVQYPHLINWRVENGPGEILKREVVALPTGNIKDRVTIVDLTASLAGKKTRLLFRGLASFDPALSETLLELFSGLSRTHLMYGFFKRAYSPGTEVVTSCDDHELDAVVLTSWNGVSLLANGRWLSLPNRSRMIILIHETLRLAQMFTPWFRDVSDQELQYITMLIHSRNFKALEGMGFYSQFRAHRSVEGSGTDEATSYRILRETLLRGKKDEFSKVVGKLLPHLRRSPESILTDIRLNDAEYKEIVDEAVFRRLQKK